MKTRDHGLSEKEMELVKLIMAECESTGDIQAKLKRLFAGTIEQMLEAEMDEHLGYEKHSAAGNNSGNSRNFCRRFPPFYFTACVRSLLSVALFGCNFSIVRNLAIIAFTRFIFRNRISFSKSCLCQ